MNLDFTNKIKVGSIYEMNFELYIVTNLIGEYVVIKNLRKSPEKSISYTHVYKNDYFINNFKYINYIQRNTLYMSQEPFSFNIRIDTKLYKLYRIYTMYKNDYTDILPSDEFILHTPCTDDEQNVYNQWISTGCKIIPGIINIKNGEYELTEGGVFRRNDISDGNNIWNLKKNIPYYPCHDPNFLKNKFGVVVSNVDFR